MDFLLPFLLGGLVVLLAGAMWCNAMWQEIIDLRIELENARTSIDYWHDQYEKESNKK